MCWRDDNSSTFSIEHWGMLLKLQSEGFWFVFAGLFLSFPGRQLSSPLSPFRCLSLSFWISRTEMFQLLETCPASTRNLVHLLNVTGGYTVQRQPLFPILHKQVNSGPLIIAHWLLLCIPHAFCITGSIVIARINLSHTHAQL